MCIVQYMCLSCSIDLVSICANKEINNNTKLIQLQKKIRYELKETNSDK